MLVLIHLYNTNSIASACNGRQIRCPKNWDCSLECIGQYSCGSVDIYGPKECGKSLNVTANGVRAFYGGTIHANYTENLLIIAKESGLSFYLATISQIYGESMTIYASGAALIFYDMTVNAPRNGEVNVYVNSTGVDGYVLGESTFNADNSTNIYFECFGRYACYTNTIYARYSNQLIIDATGEWSLFNNTIYCNNKVTDGERCKITGNAITDVDLADGEEDTRVIIFANNIYAKQGTTDLQLYCDVGPYCVDGTSNHLICGSEYQYTEYPCYFIENENKANYWICGDDNSTRVSTSSEFCNSYVITSSDETSISDAYFNLINSNAMAWVWFFGGLFLALTAIFIWSYWCFVDHTQAGLWWYEKMCPKIDDATRAQYEIANQPS